MTKKLDELKAKQKALADRIRREENKLKGSERKQYTRRMVLTGVALTAAATKDGALEKLIQRELQSFLTKPADRILFGLPVTEETTKAG